LENGLSQDPTDTDLLLRVARTYAMQGEKDKTLRVLERCFAYLKQAKITFEKEARALGVSGQMSLPDLNDYPAFKELMKDKAFRDAVKAMSK
jgi:hypothetical protein